MWGSAVPAAGEGECREVGGRRLGVGAELCMHERVTVDGVADAGGVGEFVEDGGLDVDAATCRTGVVVGKDLGGEEDPGTDDGGDAPDTGGPNTVTSTYTAAEYDDWVVGTATGFAVDETGSLYVASYLLMFLLTRVAG